MYAFYRYADKADGGAIKYLLFGGYSKQSGGLMNDLWSFDPKRNAWTAVEARGDLPCPRRDHSACVVSSSEMLVFGGFNGEENMGDFYSLNLATQRWARLAPKGELPCARRQHSLCRVDRSHVVICGGLDGGKVLQVSRVAHPLWWCWCWWCGGGHRTGEPPISRPPRFPPLSLSLSLSLARALSRHETLLFKEGAERRPGMVGKSSERKES